MTIRRFVNDLAEQSGPLFGRGIKYKEFEDGLVPHFSVIPDNLPSLEFSDVREFITKQIADEVPVLLSYQPKLDRTFSHCTVAVGSVMIGGAEQAVYLVDPYLDCPEGTLFNNWIQNRQKGGAKIVRDRDGEQVKIDWCFAFRPRERNLA